MFRLSPFRPVLGGIVLALAVTTARADECVAIDFPMSGRKVVASGLAAPPRQVATPDGRGYAEVLLRPARKDYQVFLTLVFQEDGERGLALFWKGDVSGRQVTLSENLAEGVVGLNRRTILLPAEISNEAGRLYVIGRQDRLVRLRIDWCQPATTAVAADQERPALLLGGSRLFEREVTGQAVMTPPDVWFGRVLDAALQDGVADLSENTELVVPLKGVAGTVRLRARFLGLSLGRGVRVWVNGRPAGRLVPAIPSLTDPGYVRRDKRTAYAGWREAALLLPADSLKDGENSIIFESPGAGVYLSGAALEIESPESSETALSGEDTPSAPAPAPELRPTPTPTPPEDLPVAPLHLDLEPPSPFAPMPAPSPSPSSVEPSLEPEDSVMDSPGA